MKDDGFGFQIRTVCCWDVNYTMLVMSLGFGWVTGMLLSEDQDGSVIRLLSRLLVEGVWCCSALAQILSSGNAGEIHRASIVLLLFVN